MTAEELVRVQQIILATIRNQRDAVGGPPSDRGLAWAIAHTLDEHGTLDLGGAS